MQTDITYMYNKITFIIKKNIIAKSVYAREPPSPGKVHLPTFSMCMCVNVCACVERSSKQ